MKKMWMPLLAVAMLTACGGGGSGGGSTSMSLSVTPSSLNFGAPSGGAAPASQRITGAISNATGSLYMTVARTDRGIAYVTEPTFSGETGYSDVGVKDPAAVGPGDFRDTVTVTVCTDPGCTKQISGSPKVVSVRYIVGLAVAPSSLSFQAVETKTPSAQTLNLALFSGSAPWTASIAYAEGSDWLQLSSANGTTLPATTQLSASALSAGTYHATITFKSGAETTVVPVVYTVSNLLKATAITPFSITNATTSAGYSKSATISSNDPDRQLNWSAISSESWLAVSPPSGDTNANRILGLSIVNEPFLKLHNGSHTASITLSSTSPGVSPQVINVSVTKDISQINYVAPYVAFTDKSGQVILRGERFDARPPTSIKFGAIAATSFTVVSATEIRAVAPALPEGSYHVVVESAGGTVGSSADLVVVDPPQFSQAAIPASNGCTAFRFYDAERETVYMTNQAFTACRYRREGAAWIYEMLPLEALDVGMSPDGREIILLGGRDVSHLDPVTLTVKATVPWPHTEYNPYNFLAMGISNAGTAVIGNGNQTLYLYDLYKHTFDIRDPRVFAPLARFSSSMDGSTILMGGGDYHYTYNPVYRYDSSPGTAGDSGIDLELYSAQLTRDGQRALLYGGKSNNGFSGFSVVDGATKAGSLPINNGGNSFEYLISPDGRFALQSQGSLSYGQYRKFDLTATDSSGNYSSTGPYSVSLAPGGNPRFAAMTPDGASFFLISDDKLWTELVQ